MSLVARTFRALKNFNRVAFSDRYLLLTNISISLGLSSTGDFLEQQYERMTTKQGTKYDLTRTRNMGLSAVSVGFICHYWYHFLDKKLPGRSINVVMKKLILDQLICSPVYISAFFITMAVLENQSVQEVCDALKEKAVRLYMAEWMVWPPAQFINFYWLPTRYRVFYDNLISLGYDVYTSHVIHNSDEHTKGDEIAVGALENV